MSTASGSSGSTSWSSMVWRNRPPVQRRSLAEFQALPIASVLAVNIENLRIAVCKTGPDEWRLLPRFGIRSSDLVAWPVSTRELVETRKGTGPGVAVSDSGEPLPPEGVVPKVVPVPVPVPVQRRVSPSVLAGIAQAAARR